MYLTGSGQRKSAEAQAKKSPVNANNERNNNANANPSTVTTPVLIYGWAGGIIDVYSCELMEAKPYCRPMIGHREMAALEELVSNGSTELLYELLSTMEDTAPMLSHSVWKHAWEEVKINPLN